MSDAAQWRLLGVHADRGNDIPLDATVLAVARPSGSVVTIPLSYLQLLRLVRDASARLVVVTEREGRASTHVRE